MAYEIRFALSAKRQLGVFRVRERAMIVAGIENQLAHEPLVETRNRKRLRANPIAPWELRVRDMRVFYEVDKPDVVTILAIGKKRGTRLYIQNEEVRL